MQISPLLLVVALAPAAPAPGGVIPLPGDSLGGARTGPFPAAPAALRRWGAQGHIMTARAAHHFLPDEMPAFFREAVEQLAWLNPEPDRWRDRAEASQDGALDGIHGAEHWINFELLPPGALEAENRYRYALVLEAAGTRPEEAGTLPYRIVELTQLLRSGFRRWRSETNPATRAFLEARIINDAGILGHYISDGANPHHTTIHHNGWVGENPRGFTTEPGFHGRFESQFVGARVRLEHLLDRIPPEPRLVAPLREETVAYLRRAHSQLERLYELDRVEPFGVGTQAAEHLEFAVDRLMEGVVMLRDIWYTAWVNSSTTTGEP